MKRILFILTIILIANSAFSQMKYSIPVKIWAYGFNNAPSYDDVKFTMQNLNNLNSQEETQITYYLADLEFVKKKKFDNFGFYGQMPWQSFTRHEKNILNIALVGRLKKSGKENKNANYTGVCFGPTGSVVVTKGEDPSVVTHEVGHFLGLKHEFDILDNIMSYNPDKSARRKFTDNQKITMLSEAKKMKHSNKWQIADGEKLPDSFEPDFCHQLATPIRNGATQEHTLHRTVDKKGDVFFNDEDWIKFSISKKITLDDPKLLITLAKDTEIYIELLNSELGLVKTKKLKIEDETATGEISFSLDCLSESGTFYARIFCKKSYTSEYKVTLMLNKND